MPHATQLHLVPTEAPASSPWQPRNVFVRPYWFRKTRTDKPSRAELVNAAYLVAELLADAEPVSGRLPARHVDHLRGTFEHLVRRLDLHGGKK